MRMNDRLKQVVASLDSELHLLVYVMQGGQIPSTAQKDYHIYFDLVCRRQVPIVAVITGLENRGPSMDKWWSENKSAFDLQDMSFHGHACITATKGKKSRRQDLYETSKQEVERLLSGPYRKV
jgi:hypothetical protein